MPAFVDSDDDEEDELWNEWNEDNNDEDQLRVVCLFCNNNQETVPALLSHMTDNHRFDFMKFIHEEKMGTYERMKFVNFLRKKTFNTPKTNTTEGQSPKPVELPKKEEWNTEGMLFRFEKTLSSNSRIMFALQVRNIQLFRRTGTHVRQ